MDAVIFPGREERSNAEVRKGKENECGHNLKNRGSQRGNRSLKSDGTGIIATVEK